MTQDQDPQKGLFQMSTHYNDLPVFRETVSAQAISTDYRDLVRKNKSQIIHCVVKSFEELIDYAIRIEGDRLGYQSSPKYLRPTSIVNMGLMVQNILDFYHKSVERETVSSLSIQQLRQLIESTIHDPKSVIRKSISPSLAVKNLQRTQTIVKKIMESLLECFQVRDLTSTGFYKYAEILKCLTNQVLSMVRSNDFLEKASSYDPYAPPSRVSNPLAETIRSPRPLASSPYTNEDELHYFPRQRIHVNRELQPHALDYIEPPHHRVYICEAAKAYAEVTPFKINKINCDKHPKYTQYCELFEIDTDNYFSGQQVTPLTYHLIPGTNRMSYYKLQQLDGELNITHQYENVKEILIEREFTDQTLSVVSPHGSIYISNTTTNKTTYDTEFWQFKFDQNSLKKRISLPNPRKRHGMVFLNNFVYLIGGTNNTSKALTTVDKYNVRKKVWTTAGNLHVGVVSPTVCTFRNRYILSCCGLNQFDYISNRVEMYDSANDGWSVIRTTINSKFKNTEMLNGGSAVEINPNVIYIFGGKRNTAFQHDQDLVLLISDVTQVKKKPSRIVGELVPTGGDKRVILSYAGNFKPNSGVVHNNSLYFLRKDIF